MFTIGQVADMYSLPVSTLRYYDKEGLFPNLQRQSGIRQFSEREVESMRLIECLKKSGLEIRDIKQFMQWCNEGPSTYEKRRELFVRRREALKEELEQLEKNMAMLEFKCWYYDTAIADGNEDRLNEIIPDKLPKDIKALYDKAHS